MFNLATTSMRETREIRIKGDRSLTFRKVNDTIYAKPEGNFKLNSLPQTNLTRIMMMAYVINILIVELG